MLRMNKLYLLIAWGITCFLFYGVAAHADEWNQSTKMAFSEPIQLPNVTLPAGTYTFKLAPSNTDRNLVQIFNADGSVLFTTETSITTQRGTVTDKTVVTLAQQPNGEPDALLKWFYPGDQIGHEFLYSAHEQQQLAHDHEQSIVASAQAESGD